MDWDGDGKLDIIVGDRSGNVHYFRRLDYGNIYLEEQDMVKVAGKPIDVGYNSAPCVTDWNEDGLPDLVVGNLSPLPAGVYLFINQGEPFIPDYQLTDTVYYMGEPIEITTAYPDIYDMNSDGLKDMIVGSSSGNIYCFVNSGTTQQPVFDDMEYLQADGDTLYICSYVRPTVCHWNADGIPDLLVGDYTGQIHLFTGIPQSGVLETFSPSVSLSSNPVSSLAEVNVTLARSSHVMITALSMDGRVIRSFDQGNVQAGSHLIQLDMSSLSGGVYLLRITSATGTAAVKVVVLR